MSKRINVYIRDKTYNLLKDYMDLNEYDMSRAVDEILYGRLNYLDEAKKKAEEKAKKHPELLSEDYYKQSK